MLTAPSALKTWLAANNVAWRADLLTLTVQSGSVYRWTTADTSLTVSSNTFLAASSGSAPAIKRGPYRKSGRLTIDTLDFTLGGPFNLYGSNSLAYLAQSGYFDGATLEVDHLIQSYPGDNGTGGNTAGGAIASWFSGNVAQVEPQGPNVILRCKSILEKLSVIYLPRFVVQPMCGNTVYDANCGLTKASYTLSGTASGTPTTTTMATSTSAITAQAASYFNLGVVTFTSGVNNGLRRSISAWTGTTFFVPLPAAPSAGDTFTVYPGCDRAQATCSSKFSNQGNFRGYPYIPSPESA